MKYWLFFTIQVSLGFTVLAQTTNATLVDDIYQRASAFYEQGKFTESLTLLDRAETLTNVPDIRVLYLKVKALYPLAQREEKYVTAFERVLPAFLTLADQQQYDPAKVQEITTLQLQFNEAKAMRKIQRDEERASFMKAKSSESIVMIDKFLATYPNSIYKQEAVDVKKVAKQKIYDDQVRLLDADLAKAKSKIGGGRFCTAMGVLTSIGCLGFIYSIVDEESDDNESDIIIASCSTVVPIIFLAIGSVKKQKGKSLRLETEKKRLLLNQQYLSVSPKLNFQQGQYGLALKLRF